MNRLICPKCNVESSIEEWRRYSAVEIVGIADISMVGDPSKPEGRVANYFYICPDCDRQVHGHEFSIEEEVPTVDQVTVMLSINLDVDPGESRESILQRVMTILEERDTYNLDSIFDDVAVSGKDF